MKILLLLAAIVVGSNSAEDESDLPVYLRGIGWRNVQAELRKDLRLSASVRPIHYALNLNVYVRGYRDSQMSAYNGTVVITLNITSPVKEVELHSLGLTIREADLAVFRDSESKSVNRGKFAVREDKETIVIPSKRFLIPGENVTVTIVYNGTARMDGRGFYESE